MHILKQFIRSPTRVAKATSTLLDHILTDANELVSQSGVLDIGLVDGIAPYREFRVKRHTEDWFDGEIMDRIKNRDKLLKQIQKIQIGS